MLYVPARRVHPRVPIATLLSPRVLDQRALLLHLLLQRTLARRRLAASLASASALSASSASLRASSSASASACSSALLSSSSSRRRDISALYWYCRIQARCTARAADRSEMRWTATHLARSLTWNTMQRDARAAMGWVRGIG